MAFCDLSLLLCMMFSRFICVVVCISSLLPSNISLYGHTTFIYLLSVGGLFLFGAIINICIQASVWPYAFIFVCYTPTSEIAVSYGNSTFNFLRNYQTVYKASTAFKIPSSSVKGFRFLNILAKTCYYLSFFY